MLTCVGVDRRDGGIREEAGPQSSRVRGPYRLVRRIDAQQVSHAYSITQPQPYLSCGYIVRTKLAPMQPGCYGTQWKCTWTLRMECHCKCHSILTFPGARRLAFNPPSDNVQSPLASWHHPFDAACLGTDFVQQQARLPLWPRPHAAAVDEPFTRLHMVVPSVVPS